MEIYTIYSVKYYVKHPWDVTTHFKYFKNKNDAESFYKFIYPKSYNNTSLTYKPVIENIAVLSDGKNSYSLGSPISILTEYTPPSDNESNTESKIKYTSPFASSFVNF
jgi:hypothetical protein